MPNTIGALKEPIPDNPPAESDLVWGRKAIAAAAGLSLNQLAHRIQERQIPLRKFGNIFYASRSELREFFLARPVLSPKTRTEDPA